jgi:hypothetical protein
MRPIASLARTFRLSPILAVLGCALAVAVATPGPASAAAGSWATQANAICVKEAARVRKQLEARPRATTDAQVFKLLVEVFRPAEVRFVRLLTAIPGPRPAAATKGLRLAKLDIEELDAAIAAYRQNDLALFERRVQIWFADNRANRALTAAGATACGGPR